MVLVIVIRTIKQCDSQIKKNILTLLLITVDNICKNTKICRYITYITLVN